MRVDAHAHVFAPEVEERRVPDALAPPWRSASVEELWSAAEPSGVTAAVLVPLDTDDSTCAAALAGHPDRCAGVAVAGPRDLGAEGPKRLKLRRESYRFDAVRMTWLGHSGVPLEQSPAWPLLREMSDQGLILWSYLGPEQARLLPELALQLPELRIVLNHLGFAPANMQVDEFRRPRFAGGLRTEDIERTRALADHPQVNLMVSGFYALSVGRQPYVDLHAATAKLVGAYGAERCLWGSDFPWIEDEPGYHRGVEAVETALSHLSRDDLDLVFGGTVRSLFTDSFHPPTKEQS